MYEDSSPGGIYAQLRKLKWKPAWLCVCVFFRIKRRDQQRPSRMEEHSSLDGDISLHLSKELIATGIEFSSLVKTE